MRICQKSDTKYFTPIWQFVPVTFLPWWHRKTLPQWPPLLNVTVLIRSKVSYAKNSLVFIGTWNICLDFMASKFFGRQHECRMKYSPLTQLKDWISWGLPWIMAGWQDHSATSSGGIWKNAETPAMVLIEGEFPLTWFLTTALLSKRETKVSSVYTLTDDTAEGV